MQRGLRDKSKRGSTTAQADNFAGAKLGKKRRRATLGMTGLGALAAMVAKARERGGSGRYAKQQVPHAPLKRRFGMTRLGGWVKVV
jgi:hypothetical protein